MIRRLVAWLAWWGIFSGLWLALVADASFAEVTAGIIATAIAATIAEAMRSQGLEPFAPKLRWLRSAGQLLERVLRDCWLLTSALWRSLVTRQPTQGVFHTIPARVGGSDARLASWRALVTIAISLAPNTYALASIQKRIGC